MGRNVREKENGKRMRMGVMGWDGTLPNLGEIDTPVLP